LQMTALLLTERWLKSQASGRHSQTRNRTSQASAPRQSGSYQGMIRQLEEELREYDQWKSGELEFPDIDRLDQIAPFITKIRIAKGGLADWEAAEDP
jgi:hypothetical protein